MSNSNLRHVYLKNQILILCLELFWRIWLQGLKNVLISGQYCFSFENSSHGISKDAEVYGDFKTVDKISQKFPENFFHKKVKEILQFSRFYFYLFWVNIFSFFSPDFKSA